MQRVLEVDEVELVAERHVRDRPRLDPDSLAEPGITDVAHRPGDRVGLELDADELRRREPPGDGDQPLATAAGDVEDTAAAAQGGHEVRQGREPLLEEDRDVLDGHRLDRADGSGAAARRSSGPFRKNSVRPA